MHTAAAAHAPPPTGSDAREISASALVWFAPRVMRLPPYLSGQIVGARIDATALDLVPLALRIRNISRWSTRPVQGDVDEVPERSHDSSGSR